MIVRIIVILLGSLLVYLAIALGLIVSQSPSVAGQGDDGALDFANMTRSSDASRLLQYSARDGAELDYRFWPAEEESAPLLVLLHGSGWHGGGYTAMADAIAGQGSIAVAVPDLRGHGVDPQRRGDIDYIGQMEDDVADLIATLRKPGQKVFLAGHSSGGGLAVRYAGGAYGEEIDGAVLIAPFLQYDAPTTRQNSGGWANPATRRIIGLVMLNQIGVTVLNGLPVIAFNFPQSILEGPSGDTATERYSYRLNASYAPRRDWKADLAALPPFLLIAGRQDEAFFAERYEKTISEVTGEGRYELLDGVGHLDIIGSEDAARSISQFVLETAAGDS